MASLNRSASRGGRLAGLAGWLGLLVLFAPLNRPAVAQLTGAEFQVFTYATGGAGRPAVAADAAGNFVVVWQSNSLDGYTSGVFGKRFTAAGLPLGSEFQVNSYTTGWQETPAVAVGDSGGFVVVWDSWPGQDGSGNGVFGQLYSPAGTPVGTEFQVNSYTTGSQKYPAVAADGSGAFVVVWAGTYGQDGSATGIFGQRFDSVGLKIGSEFLVNSYTTGFQGSPAIAATGSGNFIVVWESEYQDGSSWGIFGQRYDLAGSPLGGEFPVNSFTPSAEGFPAVAALSAGDFLVVWNGYQLDGSMYAVFGRRFNAAGESLGIDFQVNTYTTGPQEEVAVAADDAGGFVVSWTSRPDYGMPGGQDGSGPGVFAQRLDATGLRVGSELQVNTYTTGSQLSSAVAAGGSGDFVVIWSSSGPAPGAFGQRLANWIFTDGFEAGETCAWSATLGGGCP